MFLQDLRICLLLSHMCADRERVAQHQNPENAWWLFQRDFDVAVAMAVCDCWDACLIMTDTIGPEPVSGIRICLKVHVCFNGIGGRIEKSPSPLQALQESIRKPPAAQKSGKASAVGMGVRRWDSSRNYLFLGRTSRNRSVEVLGRRSSLPRRPRSSRSLKLHGSLMECCLAHRAKCPEACLRARHDQVLIERLSRKAAQSRCRRQSLHRSATAVDVGIQRQSSLIWSRRPRLAPSREAEG